MNTVEFSELCGLYGWKRIKSLSKSHHFIIEHERGVRITIPRDQLLLADEETVLGLLRFGGLIKAKRQKEGE